MILLEIRLATSYENTKKTYRMTRSLKDVQVYYSRRFRIGYKTVINNYVLLLLFYNALFLLLQ